MTRAVLERKNRTELLQLAKRAGLRGISLLKKAALIEALLHTAAAPALRRHAKKKRVSAHAPVPTPKPSPSAKPKPVKPTRKPAGQKAARSPKPPAPMATAKPAPAKPATPKPAAPKPVRSPAAPPSAPTAVAAPTIAPVLPAPVRPVAQAQSTPPVAAPSPASPTPVAKPVPSTVPAEPAAGPQVTELPAEYGRTGVVLMEIDPRHLHVYWEVTAADRSACLQKLGKAAADSTWVLRFYDTTYIQFDGTNAHAWFDVPIDLAAGNWYVELWSGGKTYCAEIGPRSPVGKFIAAARSNFVQLPTETQAAEYRPAWTHIEPPIAAPSQGPGPALPPVAPPAEPVASMARQPSGPVPIPVDGRPVAGPVLPGAVPTFEEPKELSAAKVRQHYDGLVPAAVEMRPESPGPVAEVVPPPGSTRGGVGSSPSSGASSSFGLGSGASGVGGSCKPAIDLQLNAEMVVSGRAQPGQSVQLNGRWIKVNADGTFSVRLTLPVAQD